MSIPIFAYFYPLTTKCQERMKRATENKIELINEFDLLKNAKSYFDGHTPQIAYCLGSKEFTRWDDQNESDVRKQIDIAERYKINFIFDLFVGSQNGKQIKELTSIYELFAKNLSTSKYAFMASLDRTRINLPIDKNNSIEPGRSFDYNELTARTIIDYLAENHWKNKSYFFIKGKPYLSLWANPLNSQERIDTLKEFIDSLRNYAKSKYKTEIYLVGMPKYAGETEYWNQVNVDAYTNYSFLANFKKGEPYIQDYTEEMNKRVQDWQVILQNKIKIPYIPSLSVGWDASSRGTPSPSFDDVAGNYPYTPIVTGSSAKIFSKYLKKAKVFIEQNAPLEEQYLPIFAFNEVTESGCLLPKVTDGEVNWDYLEATK